MLWCRYCRIVAADLIAYLHAWQEEGELSAAPPGTCHALLELLCLQQLTADGSQEVRGVAHVAYERSHDVIVIKGYQFQRAKIVAALALGVMLYHEPDLGDFVEANLEPLLANVRQLLTLGSALARLAGITMLADLARLSQRARPVILQVNSVFQVILRQTNFVPCSTRGAEVS